MQRLIYYRGKKYQSGGTGKLTGNSLLKVYGKPDCPSAVHRTQKETLTHRNLFDCEEEALAAGYRPCTVCMKEHYSLWRERRLMTHALHVEVAPIREDDICTIFLANRKRKQLSSFETPDFPLYSSISAHTSDLIEDVVEGGYSYIGAWESDKKCELEEYRIEGDFCIVTLMDDAGYWGRVIVWDYVQDYVVHLASAPFARCSVVFNGHVVSMHLIKCLDDIFHTISAKRRNTPINEVNRLNGILWYSVVPLGTVVPEYDEHEPDLCLLPLPVPDYADDMPDCFDIRVEGNTLVFRAGAEEYRLDSL